MAKDIVAKHTAEDDDDDDDDEEMTIDGLTPMSDAGIMEYETLRSPRNFKGDSSVRRIAPFKGNFDDTDKPDEEDDEEDDKRRRTRGRTRRTRTKTRTRRKEPDLVELSSQRRGQPPPWRVQPARALLLYRNGTRGLLHLTATVPYTIVCSVGCDELSPDTARANRWRPAGRPALLFVCAVFDQKGRFIFRTRARQINRLSRHPHMRHFACALRSGWAFDPAEKLIPPWPGRTTN